MAKIYHEEDADLKHLEGRKIAVLGYGSQGRAQAMNLKDSGADVRVGLRKNSSSRQKVEEDGLKVLETAAASAEADVVMILIPDELHKDVYERDVAPTLKKGQALAASHGFNIHFGQIVPPKDVDVFMIAPKAPGHMVRRTYEDGIGTPALVAIHQDATKNTLPLALAYAKGIGATRAGVLETTFKEETETDLFGEQAVLCGGVSELIQAGFQTLVEAGYQPEAAYFECCHEMKLIVDMINEGGLGWMRYSISGTAEYGDYSRGKRVITDDTRKEMKKILGEIQTGQFAKEWLLENKANCPSFKAMRRIEADSLIEQVGAKIRKMMPWLKKK